MATNRATFFPVGNGDTTLIEVDCKTIQTDINYRDNAENEEQPEYDFAPDLQDACYKGSRNYRLSLFVLTHPDKDHLGGFARIFYCGEPTKYGDRSKNDDKLILVEEMWVSSYASDPNYKTDISESVFDEIERRITLQGTEDGEQNGNRIRVLDTEADVTSGNFSAGIVWKLLAPTPEEAVIEEGDGEENQPSSNDSSLVIRWTVTVDGGKNHLLLGGDATVEVWDRIWDDHKKQTSELSWHVLLAPHHCSRGAMARKNADDEYEYSDNALDALGQVEGDGFVVSSSKEIKRNDDNPPSWEAKQKYLDILRGANAKNADARFLNPDTHKNGDPDPVVFDFTKTGPSLKVAGTGGSKAASLGAGATISPTYG